MSKSMIRPNVKMKHRCEAFVKMCMPGWLNMTMKPLLAECKRRDKWRLKDSRRMVCLKISISAI